MFLTEFKGYDLTKYNDFLIECSKKDYSNQKTHRHHILPRFMGGENKGNLIRINQQDHFDAHLILAFCFPIGMHENHCKSKQIIHVESGEIFRSLTQVNERFNINFPVLYRLINRGIFKYLNPKDTNPPNTSINTKTKSIRNNQTGQIYNSVKSLRDEFGFTQWELEKRIKRVEFAIFKNEEVIICQN